jgi:hypothetical protein
MDFQILKITLVKILMGIILIKIILVISINLLPLILLIIKELINIKLFLIKKRNNKFPYFSFFISLLIISFFYKLKFYSLFILKIVNFN